MAKVTFSKNNKKPKGMKPKGKRGMAAVKRLGRTRKTGGFERISSRAAHQYGSKAAGNRVAGKIYWNMVKARRRRGK